MTISALQTPVNLGPSDQELTALVHGRSGADAVKQFESVFVSMMLKQMRQSMSGEGLIPGDGSDIVGGMFDQYLGDHISEQGGLGIASSLQSSLSHL